MALRGVFTDFIPYLYAYFLPTKCFFGGGILYKATKKYCHRQYSQ